jgi:secreted trypsin-like serine protease
MKSCGLTTIINRKSLINEGIVNGQNASLGEFPWMVSVMIEGNDSKPVEVTDLCGGAIISSFWILTSVQCFRVKKYFKNQFF